MKPTNPIETGKLCVQIVAEQLISRGYNVVAMPHHNVGFDLKCASPQANAFEVEVKRMQPKLQTPMQVKTHLEASLQPTRFYILPELIESTAAAFFIMTHNEIRQAWSLMPRFTKEGKPYVIRNRGHIDRKHIEPHRNCWHKLPK